MNYRLHIDAAKGKSAREQQTANRIADDDRNDRSSLSDPRVEPTFARESEEKARQLAEPLDALWFAAQDRQGSQRRGRVGRGDSHAVDEPRCRIFEVLDQFGGAGDVT